jgi:hypothetical protein
MPAMAAEVVSVMMVVMVQEHDGRTAVIRSGPIGITRTVVARAIGIVRTDWLRAGRRAGQQNERCEDPTSTHAIDMAGAASAGKIAGSFASKRDRR